MNEEDKVGIILDFELVPNTAWYKNLRSILSEDQWDILRKDAYSRANGKCMICGKHTGKLEAHETWDYDEDGHVQELVDIRAICTDCHEVIHIGRTEKIGRLNEAKEHYCKVNNCSEATFKRNHGMAFWEWQVRNLVKDWELDISWLKRHGFDFKPKCCPNCDNKLIINKEVGNRLYTCSKCDYKEPIICQECGKEMKVLKSQYGFFLGCTGYPSCRNIKDLK